MLTLYNVRRTRQALEAVKVLAMPGHAEWLLKRWVSDSEGTDQE